MGDVDPDSIQNLYGRIAFSATNKENKIVIARDKAADADHLESGQLISHDFLFLGDGVFFIGDDSYRSRLMKAFKHAVILCGGKPSTF